MTTEHATLDAVLWRVLALREDHPAGTCWAWMDGPEKVCGRTEDPVTPHLCGRHAPVARRRAEKASAKVKADLQKAMDGWEARRPRAEVELQIVEFRINQLDPPSNGDPASVNLPLSKRMPSDARIHELARLITRRDALRRQVGAR